VWLVVGVCALTLAGGFALKGRCLQPWTDYHQYSSLCYNDIQPLWALRGIAARTFPYVNGDLVDGQLLNGAIEYPVLSGVFMWASGALADDTNDYLVHSALLLAPFGLLSAYLLADLTGRRALLWAVAPSLVLYAFHNWDLLVVAAAVGGFWYWWRGRSVFAALCFGIGGAFKLYPLFFLVPLLLERWTRGHKREAAIVAGTGMGSFVIVNLPFALANFNGWWATFEFHRLRGPNFDNIWSVREFGPLSLPALDPGQLNLVSAVLTAAMFVGALAFGIRRLKDGGGYPFVQVSAAMLASFLLWNKVHSPQYTLWLLPFFVLLRVNIGWWVAYSIVDVAVYAGVFRFFYDVCSTNACRPFADPTFAERVMNWGVFGRAGLLGILFVIFLAAQAAPGRGASYPSARLTSDRRSKDAPGGRPAAAGKERGGASIV
jgi:uncharacterized membrane protein